MKKRNFQDKSKNIIRIYSKHRRESRINVENIHLLSAYNLIVERQKNQVIVSETDIADTLLYGNPSKYDVFLLRC